MTTTDDEPLFADDLATLEVADFCSVPGYLVLRVTTGATSLAELELDPERAAELGRLLASAVAAVERAVAADRVYVLSFAEIDRRLHFHLFPRTAALLDAYQAATGTAGEPVDGPRLFVWARDRYPAGSAPPPGSPPADETRQRLVELLPRAPERA